MFSEHSVYVSTTSTRHRGIWGDDRFYELGSDRLPKDVLGEFPAPFVKETEARWCFYPPDTTSISLPKIATWEEEDSLFDWIALFVNTPESYTVDMVRVENDMHCVIREVRTTAQNILDFITEHGVVNTACLLDQNFAGKRHVYKILRQLQSEDKIERIKQGHYAKVPCDK